jgi:ADP-ribose pyrophosphatase YjhB (NUDIX family)
MTRIFLINTEAAIYREGKWLVGIRSKNESQAPGLLSFVGGTVEHSDASTDTIESALAREAKEEADVEIKVERFVNSTSFVSNKGNHVINVVFLCSILSGEPHVTDPEEFDELLWLTTEEISTHSKAPQWLQNSIKKANSIVNS